MKIEKFDYNDIEELLANTYVISDKDKNAIVIDPSKDNDGVINYLEKHDLILKAILLTHGHFDHMRGVNRLVNKYHVPLYIHYEDEENLKDSYLNCSDMGDEKIIVEQTPILIKDGDELNILSEGLIKVIHTPFHTKGSVCYYLKDNKSTNHTYINERQLEDGEEVLLKNNAKFRLGDETFLFKMG